MKKNKKVLIVATYPIRNPQHGGQKRVSAIREVYSENFRSVKFCGVFYKGFYKDYSAEDIPVGVESSQRIQASPFIGDIICGQAMWEDEGVRRRMTNLLRSYAPDILHISQPYAYLGLEPLLRHLGLKPKIIFESQNIEGPMKREILAAAGVDQEAIDNAVRTIDEVEARLSRECDLLVACTQEDLEAHKKMGSRQLVLAQNGIAPAFTTNEEIDSWKKIFRDNHIDKKVLFVASAHPPSWTGFLNMVGKGLGFLKIDERILIAGSICDYFASSINENEIDIADATFWLRAYPCGRLSESSLGALLQLADVIILPITEGGGSNLKTAEAILANKKVVASHHALRSFEWFENFPNVWVTDEPAKFRAAVQEAIQAPFKDRSPEQLQQASTVQWGDRLHDLAERAQKL